MEAAKLFVSVEVAGVGQAQQQLGQLGAQVNTAGQQAQGAARNIDSATQATQRMGQQAGAARTGMAGIGVAAQQANQSALRATTGFSGLGTTFGGIGASSIVATAGFAGLGAVAIQGVKAGIDWESAWTGVLKTVDGTPAQLQAIEDGLRNMAGEMPIAATELAGIAEAAGQLGIETPAILDFTRVMADLGVTTNLTADEAATSLAQLANITQMSADDFDNLGSTIVALGNDGASTEAEIVALGLRLAGAGEQAGLSEADILGFASALSSVGIEAEAGGSAMSRVMTDIRNAVMDGGASLEVFASTAGMSASQFRTAFETDAAGAIVSFIEGLGRIEAEGGNANTALNELGLTDLRVADTLRRAAGSGDLFRASLETGNRAWEENTALAKEAELRYGTTESQLQILKNTANELAITLSEQTAPALLTSMDAAGLFLGLVGSELQALIDMRATVMDLGGELEFLTPLLGGGGGGAAEAVGALGGAFREAALESLPFVGTLFTLRSAWGELNPFASEHTQLTDEQSRAVQELATQILGLVPGITTAQEAQAEANLATLEADVALAQLYGTSLPSAAAGYEQLTAAADASNLAFLEQDLAFSNLNVALSDQEQLAKDLAISQHGIELATRGLADAYQIALGSMAEFNAQGSEYSGIASSIQDAYDRVMEKQAEGIALTADEILIRDMSTDAFGFLEAGMDNASTQAGIYGLAAVEVMKAQNDLNVAIENGETDLGPYRDRVADAEQKLRDMGIATGDSETAQADLAGVLTNTLVPALDDLTRKVEYISKPWLIEIDAATDAAQTELDRIRAEITKTVYLPVQIVYQDPGVPGGVPNYASGGLHRGGMALVGEEGPELVALPAGTHIIPNAQTMEFLGGYASGTGLNLNNAAYSDGYGMGMSVGGGFNDGFLDATKDIGPDIADHISEANPIINVGINVAGFTSSISGASGSGLLSAQRAGAIDGEEYAEGFNDAIGGSSSFDTTFAYMAEGAAHNAGRDSADAYGAGLNARRPDLERFGIDAGLDVVGGLDSPDVLIPARDAGTDVGIAIAQGIGDGILKTGIPGINEVIPPAAIMDAEPVEHYGYQFGEATGSGGLGGSSDGLGKGAGAGTGGGSGGGGDIDWTAIQNRLSQGDIYGALDAYGVSGADDEWGALIGRLPGIDRALRSHGNVGEFVQITDVYRQGVDAMEDLARLLLPGMSGVGVALAGQVGMIPGFAGGGMTTGAGLAWLHPQEHITPQASIPVLADALSSSMAAQGAAMDYDRLGHSVARALADELRRSPLRAEGGPITLDGHELGVWLDRRAYDQQQRTV